MHLPAASFTGLSQASHLAARARELAVQARLVAVHLGETSAPVAEAARLTRHLADLLSDAAREIEVRGSADFYR